MGADERGPSAVRSVAVTAEDVLAALEARRQRDAPVVLRMTPPYSGRMRARLHVRAGGDDPRAVHIDPAGFLAESAPPYPDATGTGGQLRADPSVEYTVERHHERHRRALEAWREAVRDHFVDEVTVETPEGERTVDVVVLG